MDIVQLHACITPLTIRNTKENKEKDDGNLSRLNEQTHCSPQMLNNTKTLESVQENQQSEVQSRLLVQESNAGAITNAAAQSIMSDNSLHCELSTCAIVKGVIPHNATISKDWHQEVEDTRQRRVQNMILQMLPTFRVRGKEKRMTDLIERVKEIECDAYEVANSTEEYLQSLSEKVCKITKERIEKHERRKEKKKLKRAAVKNSRDKERRRRKLLQMRKTIQFTISIIFRDFDYTIVKNLNGLILLNLYLRSLE